ncbi:hypothetical protein K431DRAFT_281423 [Polychaeton citri CBS 116435]|uniref:Zn(2)-C6 fungal-type domain-containing protein n=1 Tax=Polychaeton citri CBS 116435 TaxID=1314669 RepID=A0A9P4QEV9_9PEZI|nr:hypothetical protein K431DRAFT_281423 [Polychaeton citri CBS 116435]
MDIQGARRDIRSPEQMYTNDAAAAAHHVSRQPESCQSKQRGSHRECKKPHYEETGSKDCKRRASPHKRVPISCITCSEKKVKCDKRRPSCSRCSSRNIICEPRIGRPSGDGKPRRYDRRGEKLNAKSKVSQVQQPEINRTTRSGHTDAASQAASRTQRSYSHPTSIAASDKQSATTHETQVSFSIPKFRSESTTQSSIELNSLINFHQGHMHGWKQANTMPDTKDMRGDSDLLETGSFPYATDFTFSPGMVSASSSLATPSDSSISLVNIADITSASLSLDYPITTADHIAPFENGGGILLPTQQQPTVYNHSSHHYNHSMFNSTGAWPGDTSAQDWQLSPGHEAQHVMKTDALPSTSTFHMLDLWNSDSVPSMLDRASQAHSTAAIPNSMVSPSPLPPQIDAHLENQRQRQRKRYALDPSRQPMA